MSLKKRSTMNGKSRRTKVLITEKRDINHPEIKGQIELAFESGGVKYYRFKEEFRMPAGRYKYVYAYFREVDMRMSLSKLKEYSDELVKCLDGSKKIIDIEGAWRVAFALRGRTNLAFEPEGVRRLSSVVYFDHTEDLLTFDVKHGADKIEKWIKNKCLDFFLTRPISELLNLNGVSITSLEEYLREAEMILTDLALGLPRPLQESS